MVASDYRRSAVYAYGIPVENFPGMDGYVAVNRATYVIDEQRKVTCE